MTVSEEETQVSEWVKQAMSDQPRGEQQIRLRTAMFNAIDAQIKSRVDRTMHSVLADTQKTMNLRLSLDRMYERHRAHVETQIALLDEKLENARLVFQAEAKRMVDEVLNEQIDSAIDRVCARIAMGVRKEVVRSRIKKDLGPTTAEKKKAKRAAMRAPGSKRRGKE